MNLFSNYKASDPMDEPSTRVFWPMTGVDASAGRVIGWRSRDTLCVVGIVQDWVCLFPFLSGL